MLTVYKDEDATVPLMRLEKGSSPLAGILKPYLQEIAKVVGLAASAGLSNVVRVQPLMVGRRHEFFKDGIGIEVVNPSKRTDILAVGGR